MTAALSVVPMDPADLGPDVRRAVRFYRALHWENEPDRVDVVPYEPPGPSLTALGPVVAIAYDARKGAQDATWVHRFEHVRPVLAVDPDTRRLFLVGGDYDVDSRGIVG